MKLIIDIDEETYKRVSTDDAYVLGEVDFILIENAIANGTPLPKGHGRLIDADRFVETHDCCGYIEDMEVDYFNNVTPTIIEADKE